MKVKVYCVDCKAWYVIDDDTPIGEAIPGHTWFPIRDDSTVRHLTEDDELDALADAEVCPDCGAYHEPNADTGCKREFPKVKST